MAVFVAFKSTYNKHFSSSFAMQITMQISHHTTTYKTTNYANTEQIKYVHTIQKTHPFFLKKTIFLIRKKNILRRNLRFIEPTNRCDCPNWPITELSGPRIP